jgi:hypothetical protein
MTINSNKPLYRFQNGLQVFDIWTNDIAQCNVAKAKYEYFSREKKN